MRREKREKNCKFDESSKIERMSARENGHILKIPMISRNPYELSPAKTFSVNWDSGLTLIHRIVFCRDQPVCGGVLLESSYEPVGDSFTFEVDETC